MHIIPTPKQRRMLGGFCDISHGCLPMGYPSELAEEADRFALGGMSSGMPVRFVRTPVQLPEGLLHRDLLTAQAYRLVIREDEILISAAEIDGMRYALITLEQLRAGNAHAIPCQEIEDYPLIPFRGFMLDVSRGKIPRWNTLKEIIDFMGMYKYNVLQLYWEDTYKLAAHPRIGELNGHYTREETERIDRYCRSRGIELQACVQTFSHMHGVLRLPGYQHLSENKGLFTLAPGNPDVYLFLEDVLSKVLSWFSSPTMHINMDEAYDLGTGFSAPLVKKHGAGAVFAEHLQRVSDIVRKCGVKRILMWGDILQSHPELLKMLDDDIVCVDWNYNPEESYPSLELHANAKRPFWAAPGTSSWNALFPRVQNARINIDRYTAQAYQSGTQGMLLTHWGDYGHHQPFSFSRYALACAAEAAFNGGIPDWDSFEKAAAVQFFSSAEQQRGFDLLTQTNVLPSLQVGFKTQTLYMLFDDLIKGISLDGNDIYPAVPRETCASLASLAIKARQEFMHTGEQSRFTRELQLSADLLAFCGKKGMVSHDIRDAFTSGNVDEQRILGWIFTIKLLYREFSQLRHRFTLLWDEESLPQGREGALYSFEKASCRYAEGVCWLSRQRDRLLQGKPVDMTLESYTAGDSYGIMWSGDCMNMWDRAYPWR